MVLRGPPVETSENSEQTKAPPGSPPRVGTTPRNPNFTGNTAQLAEDKVPSSMESSPARGQRHRGGSKKHKSKSKSKAAKSRNSLYNKTSKRKRI
jgi:hypothetical protein